MEKLKRLIKKIWQSKLGSALIINIIWLVLISLFAIIKSLVLKIKITDVLSNILIFLNSKIEIPIYGIFVFFILAITISISLNKTRNLIAKLFSNRQTKKTEELPPFHFGSHSAYFDIRISNVFPGLIGLKWFERKSAIYRLKLFLDSPLNFKGAKGGQISPFWWFRGLSANSIESYKRIKRGVFLMNRKELKIESLAAYKSNSYYKSFLYVETAGVKSNGVHKINQKDIESIQKKFGYAWEEYCIIQGNRKVSLTHLEDGATMIRNKVVPIKKSTTRMRFLTKYNFLIAPNDSPINNSSFEIVQETYLTRLINEDNKEEKINILNEFIAEVEKMYKKQNI